MTTKTKILLTAQDRTKSAFNSVTRRMSGLERSVGKAQQAFAALVGAGAIGGMVKTVNDAGLAMDRFNRSFRAATGSFDGGAREMEFVTELTQKLGTSLEASAGSYAKLTAAARGTELAGNEIRNVFSAVSEASLVLGLSAEQTQGTLTAIEQIISKGKVSAEELKRQLGERLPGAFQIAARAIGVTTGELDKMLRMGELTAEELLPKLADELRNTFGSEVEEAANSTQAALARFSNAVFRLKAALAESGVSEALATFAEGIAAVAAPTLQQDISETDSRIYKLRKQIERLESDDKPGGSRLIEGLKESLGEAERHMDSLLLKVGRLNEGALKEGKDLELLSRAVKTFGDANDTLNAVFDDQAAAASRFTRRYETAEQKVSRLREELKRFKEELDPAEYKRIFEAIGQELTDGIELIDLNSLPRMKGEVKDAFTDISEYQKQAARNMQDVFSDFLFDPFQDGLDGMLKGFIDVMRRMVANSAAAFIFDTIGLGKIFGGARAMGGPVTAGVPYLVGEKGPELVMPNQNGTVIPNHKLGGSSVVVNQNYRIAAGADWATLQQVLPPLFDQNRQATIGDIRDLVRRGSL